MLSLQNGYLRNRGKWPFQCGGHYGKVGVCMTLLYIFLDETFLFLKNAVLTQSKYIDIVTFYNKNGVCMHCLSVVD